MKSRIYIYIYCAVLLYIRDEHTHFSHSDLDGACLWCNANEIVVISSTIVMHCMREECGCEPIVLWHWTMCLYQEFSYRARETFCVELNGQKQQAFFLEATDSLRSSGKSLCTSIYTQTHTSTARLIQNTHKGALDKHHYMYSTRICRRYKKKTLFCRNS